MNANNLILTGCEILASCLLIYGFTKEDKIIQIEQDLKRIIKGNYKRLKRSLKK
jgi:hypothetical protein